MSLIDVGSGPPLVLVPGIQGRWEYQRPCIDALAKRFRVLSLPLCGERGSEGEFTATSGFDNDARQIATILDRSGVDRVTICGVSFGGLVAVRFAAMYRHRVKALVLASTPGPEMHLRRRHVVYARLPGVFGPLFFAETPFRVRPELLASFPHRTERWRFSTWMLGTFARAPVSARRMAGRAALLLRNSVLDDCMKVTAPTLIISGERGLDRVVRVDSTLKYLELIAEAQHRVLTATGHLGSVTRPDAFADLVSDFLERARENDAA